MASLPLPPTLGCSTLLMPRGFLGLEPIQHSGTQAPASGPRSDMILPGILRDNKFCGSDSLPKEERCYRNLVILFRLLYHNKNIPIDAAFWQYMKEGWGLGVAMNCTPEHVRDIAFCYQSARYRWVARHGRAFKSILTSLVDNFNSRGNSKNQVKDPRCRLIANQFKWMSLLSSNLAALLDESNPPDAFSKRSVMRMLSATASRYVSQCQEIQTRIS
jgi:hypothetical protein